MTKKVKTPPKNVGGRPRKPDEEKARRIALWIPGTHFHALLGRARALKIEPQRAPNVARGRSELESEDATVAAYSKSALMKLADGILKAQGKS